MTAQVSRRQLLRFGIGGTLGAGLAVSGLSLFGAAPTHIDAAPFPATPPPPTGAPLPVTQPAPTAGPIVIGPAPRRLPTLPAFSAYHGVTGAEHQSRFDDLGARGYRMISLSIYGTTTDPRYAAVWVLKPAVAQIGVHGVTADEYQRRFDAAVAQGYAPIIVSATGKVQNALFAAVFEKGVPGRTVARHGVPFVSGPTGWFDVLDAAKAQGLIPRSIAVYGSTDLYGAVVFQENTAAIPWAEGGGISAEDYQGTYNSWIREGYRPSYVTGGPTGGYSGIFRKDAVTPWEARHHQTSDEYQATFTDLTARGYIPICVQGSGNGVYTRYASVFVTVAGYSAL